MPITKVELVGFAAGVLAAMIVLYVLLAHAIAEWLAVTWSRYRNIRTATKITFGFAYLSLLAGVVANPERLSPLHLAIFFTILAAIMGLQDLDHKVGGGAR